MAHVLPWIPLLWDLNFWRAEQGASISEILTRPHNQAFENAVSWWKRLLVIVKLARVQTSIFIIGACITWVYVLKTQFSVLIVSLSERNWNSYVSNALLSCLEACLKFFPNRHLTRFPWTGFYESEHWSRLGEDIRRCMRSQFKTTVQLPKEILSQQKWWYDVGSGSISVGTAKEFVLFFKSNESTARDANRLFWFYNRALGPVSSFHEMIHS